MKYTQVILSVVSVFLFASLLSLVVTFYMANKDSSLFYYSLGLAVFFLFLSTIIAHLFNISPREIIQFLLKYNVSKEIDSTNHLLLISVILISISPFVYSYAGTFFGYLTLFTGGTLLAMAVSGYVVLLSE